MKERIERSKSIIISIILLIIIGIISLYVIKSIRNNGVYVAPNIEIEEDNLENDDILKKYKNNINGIEIKDRNIEKIDGEFYICIELFNNTEEDKFKFPIGIEFVNIDGDVIYNTGFVIDVLLKGMTQKFYAPITSKIANMFEDDKIDHLIINQLQ